MLPSTRFKSCLACLKNGSSLGQWRYLRREMEVGLLKKIRSEGRCCRCDIKEKNGIFKFLNG